MQKTEVIKGKCPKCGADIDFVINEIGEVHAQCKHCNYEHKDEEN